MARLGRTTVRKDSRGRSYGVGKEGRIPVKEARRRLAISEFARKRERTSAGTFEELPEFDIEVEVRDDYKEE